MSRHTAHNCLVPVSNELVTITKSCFACPTGGSDRFLTVDITCTTRGLKIHDLGLFLRTLLVFFDISGRGLFRDDSPS